MNQNWLPCRVIDMDVPEESETSRLFSYYVEPLLAFESENETIELSTTEIDFLSPQNQALLLSSPPLHRQSLLHIQINETVQPKHILSRSVRKYYHFRHHLFSRWDLGIQFDEEGLFSATPECLALHTAIRCSCGVVIDAFAGIGGNTIQLARTCRRVISIELNEQRLRMLKHNSTLYKVDHKIDCICGDSTKLLPSMKADVVLLAPPWGGVDYSKKEEFHLSDLPEGLNGSYLFQIARRVTRNVVFVLPRTINKREIALLADPGEMVEFVEGYVDNHLKMVTVYFGELVQQGNEENTTILMGQYGCLFNECITKKVKISCVPKFTSNQICN